MSSPKTPSPPAGLATGGRALWRSIVAEHELDAAQLVQLTEACRMKDRCDELDRIVRGKGVLELMQFRSMLGSGDGSEDSPIKVEIKFDSVIDRANATANAMKQLLAALRLPDPATGKRPQYRGPRGAQKPTVPGGSVSSLDRARAAKSG